MKKSEGISKSEGRTSHRTPERPSTFWLWNSFVICHSSFVIRQPVHGKAIGLRTPDQPATRRSSLEVFTLTRLSHSDRECLRRIPHRELPDFRLAESSLAQIRQQMGEDGF